MKPDDEIDYVNYCNYYDIQFYYGTHPATYRHTVTITTQVEGETKSVKMPSIDGT